MMVIIQVCRDRWVAKLTVRPRILPGHTECYLGFEQLGKILIDFLENCAYTTKPSFESCLHDLRSRSRIWLRSHSCDFTI